MGKLSIALSAVLSVGVMAGQLGVPYLTKIKIREQGLRVFSSDNSLCDDAGKSRIQSYREAR